MAEPNFDAMILSVVRDPNTEDIQDHSFFQDLWADEWESRNMDQVAVQHISEAKKKELTQLRNINTLEVAKRSQLESETIVVGT